MTATHACPTCGHLPPDPRDESERAFDAAYYPNDDLSEFETWCRENGHEDALEAISEFRVDNETAAEEMGE